MNVAELRSLFPALEQVVYLNTPTASPAARPVLDAVRGAEAEWERGEFSWQAWEAEGDATRETFASLVGGQADHVSLVSGVAHGAATIAASLPRGRVVVGAREFQSNLFPWLALRDRGFEVVEVQPDNQEVVRTEALVQAIDERTVLVAVTEVQSSNGFRVRLAEVGARCREVGARLFVDLAQSLGALRFDAGRAGADFVASHGYKWLLAPRGAAWLWVRPELLGTLQPLAPSWKTVADPYAEYYGGPMELPDNGRRLDATMPWFSWVGARAALDLIRSLDAREVEAHCLKLAGAFREEAESRGLAVVPQEEPSQTVALRAPDPAALRERLRERRVIGAVRGGFLRLGFHAYNDESDVKAALEALGRP
ncbi:MAG TPA: aminotransferase class V-fold PLP-dependent enzyme [Actinomycetota bacterium]|nr:aminotransferase class V-fold PLP-dependent enzyme [Actinomycetota bacterium]